MNKSAPGIRARVRAEMTDEIKTVARRHLAAEGANLSLRAVARDMGMVSSALYRYFAGRDELLTALIIDAYNSIGQAVEDADAATGREDLRGRWMAVSHAVRDWALARPHEYALIYGSPVPGYAAPAEVTNEPGTRVIGALLTLVGEGVATGDVPDRPAPHEPPEPLATDLRAVGAEVGLATHPAVLARAMLLWSTVVGGTSLEVFGQYGPDTLHDPAQAFEQQVRMALAVLRGTLDQR